MEIHLYQQNLITDLAANGPILAEINQMAASMIQNKHSQSDAIRRRQKEINERSEFILNNSFLF